MRKGIEMIKVGQKFRYIGGASEYYTFGKVYAVKEAFEEQLTLEDDCNTAQHWWTEESMVGEFESVDSPVQTVVSRKLVSGNYGRIFVDGAYGETINLAFLTRNGKASGLYGFNAEELEEASKVFAELANFLGEQK